MWGWSRACGAECVIVVVGAVIVRCKEGGHRLACTLQSLGVQWCNHDVLVAA